MIRNKYSVDIRNRIVSDRGYFDSMAAIEGARMTTEERDFIKSKLTEVISYIDNKILIKK